MSRKKILLVDDSSTILMMEKSMLNTGAYDLVTAKNGQEALDRANSESPDLILMDVNMPILDGFGALREFRKIPQFQQTPIIMVTTRGEAVNVNLGYEYGCNDYVTKPIDSLELLSKIKSYIGE